MNLAQAKEILQAEVGHGTATGAALVYLLTTLEREAYRQSSRVADPFLTGKICGQGEGIAKVLNAVSPTQQPQRMTSPLPGPTDS